MKIFGPALCSIARENMLADLTLLLNYSLKGQCHKIFDLCFFFNQSTPPRNLINRLKPFRMRCQWHRWNLKWGLGNFCFYLKYSYSRGIFAIEIFLLDLSIEIRLYRKGTYILADIPGMDHLTS
jgi:hypothetical protein